MVVPGEIVCLCKVLVQSTNAKHKRKVLVQSTKCSCKTLVFPNGTLLEDAGAAPEPGAGSECQKLCTCSWRWFCALGVHAATCRRGEGESFFKTLHGEDTKKLRTKGAGTGSPTTFLLK